MRSLTGPKNPDGPADPIIVHPDVRRMLLTQKAFAEGSSNSTVGLTGRALVIDDVGKHVEAGGGLYVCDAEVQSEACLPLLDDDRNVVGILDAEAKARSFYGSTRLATLSALAIVAAAVLP